MPSLRPVPYPYLVPVRDLVPEAREAKPAKMVVYYLVPDPPAVGT